MGEGSLTQVHRMTWMVTGSSGVNGSRTTSTLYSCMTTKLNQMEYQVTCLFPTLYQLNLNDQPHSGKCSLCGKVLNPLTPTPNL